MLLSIMYTAVAVLLLHSCTIFWLAQVNFSFRGPPVSRVLTQESTVYILRNYAHCTSKARLPVSCVSTVSYTVSVLLLAFRLRRSCSRCCYSRHVRRRARPLRRANWATRTQSSDSRPPRSSASARPPLLRRRPSRRSASAHPPAPPLLLSPVYMPLLLLCITLFTTKYSPIIWIM